VAPSEVVAVNIILPFKISKPVIAPVGIAGSVIVAYKDFTSAFRVASFPCAGAVSS
jgi:hypothetical protein